MNYGTMVSVTEPCNKYWPSIEDYTKALSSPLESLQRLKRFKPYIHPDGSLDYWNDSKKVVFHMIDSLQVNYEFGLECCLTEDYWKSISKSFTLNDEVRIYHDEIRIKIYEKDFRSYPVVLHRNYHMHEPAEPKCIKESKEIVDNRLFLSEDKKTVLFWNESNGLIGKSLTTITIPEGVENIADGAFSGCENLGKVILPSTLKRIGKWSFVDCNLLSIVSKTNHLEEVGEYAFSGCLLRYESNTIGLPWTIGKIDKNSFKNTIVEFKKKMYIINISNCRNGWKAEFENYPDEGKPEEQLLFDYKALLQNSVEDSDGVVYDNSYRYILNCNNKSLEKYKVKDSAIGILKEAFRECSHLKEVDLTHVEYISENAFCGCENLVNIKFSSILQNIGSGAFARTGLNMISLPDTIIKIGEDAFSNCKKLTDVIIRGELEELPARVFFGCRQLKHVFLNNNLKILGMKSFGNCKSLTSITLPPSIRKLGEFCFEGSSLTEIKLPKSLVAMDYSPFCGCRNIKIISESPFFFANEQFLLGYNKTRLISYLLDEIHIVIPGTVRVILGYSLSNNKYAKRIYLPDSVEYIGHWAFRNAHAECVNIPKSIMYIKPSFDYCACISKYLVDETKLLEGTMVSQAEIVKY